MRAMYRKEAQELAFLFIPTLVAISVAWVLSLSMADAFMRPRDEPQAMVWLTASAAGILLAYWQFAGERARGTHAYLVHRGLSPAQIVRAKSLLGAGAAFLLGIVPPLASATWHALVDGDGGVLQIERLGEYALLALTGVSAYAVAAQNATSHPQEPGRALARFVFVVGVVAVQYWLLFRMFWVWAQDLVGAGAVGLGLGVAAISVPAFWIATRRFERGLDGSRPVAPREALVTAATMALFVLVPTWMFFGASERMLARNWLQEFPMILHRGDEQWAVGDYEGGSRLYLPLGVDAGDVPGAEENPWTAYYRPTHPWAEERVVERPKLLTRDVWKAIPHPDAVPLFEGPQGNFHVRSWILQPLGEMRVFFAAQELAARKEETREPTPTSLAGARSRVLTVRRPDGVPLSLETEATQAPDGHTVLLFDPADRTLWRFAPELLEAGLVALELPDGAEPEGFVQVLGAQTRFRPSAVQSGDTALVYLDGELRPIGEAPGLSLWAAAAGPKFKREVHRTALFEQTAVVRGVATGEELFKHSWSGRGGAGFPTSLLTTALQAVQGPLPIALSSYFASGDPPFNAQHIGLGLALHDPLYFGGRFAWVLAIHAGLAVILAVGVHRRARRGGLSALRGGLWTGAVLLGGVWVSIVFLVAEPAATRKPCSTEAVSVPREVLVVRVA